MSKILNIIEKILVIPFLLLPGSVLAQGFSTEDHLSLDFLRPQITAGYSSASARLFQDVEGSYGAASAALLASVPLYQEFSSATGSPTSYFLLARGQFSSLYPEVSFIPRVNAVYSSTLGITGGIRTPSHHLYLLTLNAGIAEDDKTVTNALLRPTGSLLGEYRLDDAFAFIYGLSYSFTFDRGLLLPLLGTHCRLSNHITMHLVLPYSLELEYREVEALKFAFIVRANGYQARISQDNFPGPLTSSLYLKSAQVQAAFNVTIGLGNSLWLCGEAGLSRDRNLALGPLDRDLVSVKIRNAGYSSVILKYEIDSSDHWLW